MLEEFYKENLSWNERISNVLGKNHSFLDPYILDRNPKLSFNDNGKIDIDVMYPPSMEVREDSSPYDEFFKCIRKTFNLNEIESFCDVGCSTGFLVRNMLPHANSCGIEYFEYQKENADDIIKECINIFDIRDPIEENVEFDLVSCTEVAEHVDPKYLHIFLDNISKITSKYLILTWSSTYPPEDAPPQHVSPLEFSDVVKVMEEWGFELDDDKTQVFLNESMRYRNFYFWWRESLSIWRKKTNG